MQRLLLLATEGQGSFQNSPLCEQPPTVPAGTAIGRDPPGGRDASFLPLPIAHYGRTPWTLSPGSHPCRWDRDLRARSHRAVTRLCSHSRYALSSPHRREVLDRRGPLGNPAHPRNTLSSSLPLPTISKGRDGREPNHATKPGITDLQCGLHIRTVIRGGIRGADSPTIPLAGRRTAPNRPHTTRGDDPTGIRREPASTPTSTSACV
jgi:hypothetical protein